MVIDLSIGADHTLLQKWGFIRILYRTYAGRLVYTDDVLLTAIAVDIGKRVIAEAIDCIRGPIQCEICPTCLGARQKAKTGPHRQHFIINHISSPACVGKNPKTKPKKAQKNRQSQLDGPAKTA